MANDDSYKRRACRVHAFDGERMIAVSGEHVGFMHVLFYDHSRRQHTDGKHERQTNRAREVNVPACASKPGVCYVAAYLLYIYDAIRTQHTQEHDAPGVCLSLGSHCRTLQFLLSGVDGRHGWECKSLQCTR